jgi:vacuolar-type H+-ATPase subunit H
LASDAAERIGAIIEAAEQAAAAVIDDAEMQARKYLSDTLAEADQLVADRLASISDLTDSLVAQAEEIRSRSDRLLASLEQAKSQLAAGGSVQPRAVAEAPLAAATEPATRGSHLSAVAPVEEREVAAEPPREERGTPAGARLLATQMAVSGSSREEIAARLRTGFEIEDTSAILDAILGPED